MCPTSRKKFRPQPTRRTAFWRAAASDENVKVELWDVVDKGLHPQGEFAGTTGAAGAAGATPSAAAAGSVVLLDAATINVYQARAVLARDRCHIFYATFRKPRRVSCIAVIRLPACGGCAASPATIRRAARRPGAPRAAPHPRSLPAEAPPRNGCAVEPLERRARSIARRVTPRAGRVGPALRPSKRKAALRRLQGDEGYGTREAMERLAVGLGLNL